MTEFPRELRAEDLQTLATRGIAEDEARRQLAILRHPPEPVRLIRPCTLGDGILAVDAGEASDLASSHAESARNGNVMKLVPASGAATRMFRDLLAVRADRCPATRVELVSRATAGDGEARTLLRFVDEVDRFAFADALRRVLANRGRDLARLAADGPFVEILDALVDPTGLGYASQPKGLLPFHRYGADTRTALEEHLVEAAQLTRDADAVCRVHFTTSPDDRAAFALRVESARARLEHAMGVRFEVAFSTQQPSTETLAADAEGAPFRDERGALVLRPGGHGALIQNLADLDADLVHLKNIDNVAIERISRHGIVWKKALAGLAMRLRRETGRHLADIEAGRSDSEELATARAFARDRFGVESADASPSDLAGFLRRPLRVCGVVRNTGEPGGGPFWVRGRDGRASRQIVEAAQVDERSEEQRAIFASSTHFNPVDMVLALRDSDGHRHDLRRHVDPEAVFVSWKSWQGKRLLALERPGLWNGAMADWNTVFVEIPGETFTPVKTVLDLLRPEHQP